ncbi:MAG: glycosyltransferase family 4 protein [Gammaproteobacteria bacterium]|nr:glycosyltransferase family 4 protein [Gammaproteobacteria bacterium]
MNQAGKAKAEKSQRKIGYVVPGFPGQTHIFFWRELAALRAIDIDPRIVSTRPPDARIQSHSWTQEARQRTNYLFPVSLPELFGSILFLLYRGSRLWGQFRRGLADRRIVRVFRNFALLLVGAKLAKCAEREGWCHIHVHSCADAALVVAFASLLSRIPYSMTLHGPLSDYGAQQPFKWAGAAFGIVITRTLLLETSAILGKNMPEIIEVAPMGVDPNRVKRTSVYQPWPGSGKILLVSCGRLNPVKGHKELVEAVAVLLGLRYEVSLRICGQDELGGDGYATELQTVIESLGVGSAVTLLGAVDEDRVLAELEQAHIFVLASYHEPLGVAYMEAMAMNVPTIGTNAGGVAELITDGVDGLLVEPRNPEALVEAVLKILLDPAFAQRLADSGRDKVERRFHSGVSAEVLGRNIQGSDTVMNC